MADTDFPNIEHKRDRIWELFSVGRMQNPAAVKFVWEWNEETNDWKVRMST